MQKLWTSIQVSSHSLKNEDAPLKRFDNFPFPPRITLKDNQDFERCTDSKSRAILYPQDNFAFAAHNFERPLPLARPANSLIGRFSLRRAGIQPDLYKSVTVMGSCCWELFSGPDFTGQMLRLCKGKYTAGDLGNFANNFVSIRPVKHFWKYWIEIYVLLKEH